MSLTLSFPQPLAEKYRPHRVQDFIGLAKPKAILTRFAKKPYASAWLFLGESGVGKTTMALALAEQLKAELHHVPSRSCDLDTVENLTRICHYVPLGGGCHLILVDEADQMTLPAQHAFLSKLDATAFPPNTIFIFTANSTRYLEDRFLSRCRTLEFSGHNIGRELPAYLQRIWRAETGKTNTVNFATLAELADHNVRDALSRLEIEILSGGTPDEPMTERRRPTPAEPTRYHEAAAKAVATRERNILAKAKKGGAK